MKKQEVKNKNHTVSKFGLFFFILAIGVMSLLEGWHPITTIFALWAFLFLFFSCEVLSMLAWGKTKW